MSRTKGSYCQLKNIKKYIRLNNSIINIYMYDVIVDDKSSSYDKKGCINLKSNYG